MWIDSKSLDWETGLANFFAVRIGTSTNLVSAPSSFWRRKCYFWSSADHISGFQSSFKILDWIFFCQTDRPCACLRHSDIPLHGLCRGVDCTWPRQISIIELRTIHSTRRHFKIISCFLFQVNEWWIDCKSLDWETGLAKFFAVRIGTNTNLVSAPSSFWRRKCYFWSSADHISSFQNSFKIPDWIFSAEQADQYHVLLWGAPISLFCVLGKYHGLCRGVDCTWPRQISIIELPTIRSIPKQFRIILCFLYQVSKSE